VGTSYSSYGGGSGDEKVGAQTEDYDLEVLDWPSHVDRNHDDIGSKSEKAKPRDRGSMSTKYPGKAFKFKTQAHKRPHLYDDFLYDHRRH